MGLEKFTAALDLLKGFQVNLYVGEDIFKGKLIGVETDHVVLETDDKYIFYYNIEKIQAVLKNTRQFIPVGASVEFQKTQSLHELLHSFHYSWVTILSINKQKFYGVLSEIDEDFVTLINGEERILIKVAQISNILKGFVKEEPKKKNQKKSDSKNETQVQNQDEVKDKGEEKEDEKEKDTDKEKNQKKDTDKDKEKNQKKDTDKYKEKNQKKDKDKEDIPFQEPKDYKSVTYYSGSSDKMAKSQSNNEKGNKQKDSTIMGVEEKKVTKLWPLPIKFESSLEETKDSPPTNQKKQDENEFFKNEMKKTKNEMVQKEKKNDESKTQEVNSQHKSNKESNHSSGKSSSKKEKKQEKPQETTSTSKSAVSESAESNKKETVYSYKFNNDPQKVWKQKGQETKAVSFKEEPVTQNQERNFPFNGWPRNNNRTFRF